MDTANKQIEQQITVLLRRVQRIHLSTSTGEIDLERSAYGIMCKLADEGPQRLGALASAFGLDPSTITRQVQALEEIGLAAGRPTPPTAVPRSWTSPPSGREVLDQTRATGAPRLQEALSDWPDADRADFGRLLEEFNPSLDALLERPPEPSSLLRRMPAPGQRGPRCDSDLRPRSRCHCRYAAHQAGRLPAVPRLARLHQPAQSPASSAPSSATVSTAGFAEPGHPAGRAEHPAGRRAERAVRALERRSARSLEGGRVAGDRQRAQQERVEHLAGGRPVSHIARNAPTSSRNCWSAGSLSSTTSRSAVSSITVPAV